MEVLLKYGDIVLAFVIFLVIVFFRLDFYKVVALILELIVLIEVIQMLFIFFQKQRIKIRYMIDACIIYVIRELMLSLTEHNKNFKLIALYLFLILVFFFFRFLSLKITYKTEEN